MEITTSLNSTEEEITNKFVEAFINSEKKEKKKKQKEIEVETPFVKNSKHSIFNHEGLRHDVVYPLDEKGNIDWAKLIEPQYIVVNRKHFEDKKLPVPNSAEGLSDNQKLVLLMGYRRLANLRGMLSVEYTPLGYSFEETVVGCRITWRGNVETNMEPVTYSAIGNAGVHNTDAFFSKFLGALAENRSFVRCVRSFLAIPIYGFDEMINDDNGKSKTKPSLSPDISPTSPHAVLIQKLQEKGKTFIQLKAYLLKTGVYTQEVLDSWGMETDIPITPDVWNILKILK